MRARLAVLALFGWALGLPLTAAAVAQAQPATRCGDFLAGMHLKPPGLRYVGCRALPDQQGRPLRATYRVPGALAARVERRLVKATGMARLKRSCCQWDAPRHTFRGSDGRDYDITMVSDEGTARGRAAWPEIRVFEVVVETFTEAI